MIVLSSRQLLGRAEAEAELPASLPRHKRIPGTRFLVDAFTCSGPWSTAYFLSHFHSDHYTGLTPAWNAGIVFCSDITARLVTRHLGIPASLVVALPMDTPLLVDGSTVALVDANHCPGAVQFLFDVAATGRYVHTGDMRYVVNMKQNTLLCDFIGVDGLFLDTTYCSPRFRFPSQQESADYVAHAVQEELASSTTSTLVCIATYVIGKETLLREVIRQCKCKIYVAETKLALLQLCSQDEELSEKWLVTQPELARVHVVPWNVLGETWPFFRPNFENMERLRLTNGADKIVGFVPTGWTCNQAFTVQSKPPHLHVHLVPYSEHSSYDELREYVAFLRPREIIPTVGLDEQGLDGKAADSMRQHFRNLVDETANKRRFLQGFKRKPPLDPVFTPVFGKPLKKLKEEEEEEEKIDDHQDHHGISAPVVTAAPVTPAPPAVASTTPSQFALRRSPAKLQRSSGAKPKETKKGSSKIKKKGPAVGNQASILTFFKKKSTSQNQQQQQQVSVSQLHDDKLQQLVEVLGGDVTPEVASKLLQQANGDVSAALNLFYESPDVGGSSQQSQSDYVKKEGTTGGDYVGGFSQQSQSDYVKQEGTTGDDHVEQEICIDVEQKSLAEYCAEHDFGHEVSVDYSVTAAAVATVPAASEDQGVKKQLFHVEHESSSSSQVLALPPNKYDPVTHACWKADEAAPYLHLARTFDLVEKEAGRLKSTGILCNMFRSLIALSPNDVIPALYLTTNRLAPDYENVDLNVGGALVTTVIQEATGTPKGRLKDKYNTMGDLGDVAQSCLQNQRLLTRPRPLSIRHLFDTLKQISNETGTGSTLRRKNMILSLFQSCREKEATYLVRTLVQNMRIGAMERTVLPALAQALVMHQEGLAGSSNSDQLRCKLHEASIAIVKAYNFLPCFERLLPNLLEGEQICSFPVHLCPGIPVKPMLAKVSNELSQAVKHFKGAPFTCEFKYDGCRAQIHRTKEGSIFVFSRNCENSTSRFPDVVQVVESMIGSSSRSYILDAEVVPVDRANGNKLLAFQSLSTRERGGRKGSTSINAEDVKVEVCVFVFDILYLDGDSLVEAPLRVRRQRLHELLPNPVPGYLDFAAEKAVECAVQESATMIDEFFKSAILTSCEGLILKALDKGSEYAPAKRADAWLKLKKDYVDGLTDTLDLVPIGAWHGNGRKAGWLSPFLMACYDPDKEEFQSVCRVMSGFSDAFYEEMNVYYREGNRVLSKKPPYYMTLEEPDVWLSAEVVWEIRGADYTISPVHQAAIGLVHPSKGISVRFPRFVRVRNDKSLQDATSSWEMAQHFQVQANKQV